MQKINIVAYKHQFLLAFLHGLLYTKVERYNITIEKGDSP